MEWIKELFYAYWFVIPLAIFLYTIVHFYGGRRFKKDEALRKVVEQSIDEIKDDGAAYWLSKEQETRLRIAAELKYKLKRLGPLLQALFDDPVCRQELSTLIKQLRQQVTGGDFEQPGADPVPDPEAAGRIAYDVAKLRLYIQGHTRV
ncbi:MAG: hypothetical protein HQL80_09975 [Magnetococcales bacterium]|nr:hypothetical protein [Magnetococcales bacterium]